MRTRSSKRRTRQVETKFGGRDISEVVRNKSFAFYGKSGSGKTTLACTFPTPILLIDINDEGTDSVSDMADEDLKVWDIEEFSDIEEPYNYLKANKGEYKTVILDTVTMLQTKAIEEQVGEKLAKQNKNPGDWGTMTKQDWGRVAAQMKIWITRYRNLPMNVIFIAQERTFNLESDDDDDIGLLDPEVGPELRPSVKSHLNAAVTMIANTYIRRKVIKKKDEKGRLKETKKYEYCLGVGPSDIFTRKVRKPKKIILPEAVVDPDYEDLIAIIKGDE